MGNGSGFPVNEKQFFEPRPGPVVFAPSAFGLRQTLGHDRSFPEYGTWPAPGSGRSICSRELFRVAGRATSPQNWKIRARASQAGSPSSRNRWGQERCSPGGPSVPSDWSCVIEPNTTVAGQAPAQPAALYPARRDRPGRRWRSSCCDLRLQRDKNVKVFEQLAASRRQSRKPCSCIKNRARWSPGKDRLILLATSLNVVLAFICASSITVILSPTLSNDFAAGRPRNPRGSRSRT